MDGVGEVVARCEGCGLVVEFDDLRLLGQLDPVGDCGECCGPVYLVDPDELVEDGPDAEAIRTAYAAGWVDGWDANSEVSRGFVETNGINGHAYAVLAAKASANRYHLDELLAGETELVEVPVGLDLSGLIEGAQ